MKEFEEYTKNRNSQESSLKNYAIDFSLKPVLNLLRFYAVYDKVYRHDILEKAYRLVRSSNGSPGIDDVSFKMVEQGVGVNRFLAERGKDLKEGIYKASPVPNLMVGQRPLSIPIIKDRVAQMAVKLVIEPIFESDFVETSYGFRPKKGCA